MDDGFIISQWFATPIGRDEGKKAVLDLVSFTPRREMTDRDGQADFIREGLQLQFPKPQSPAIAPPAVGRNQDLACRRIEPFASWRRPRSAKGPEACQELSRN
jgi:hypothetical protein